VAPKRQAKVEQPSRPGLPDGLFSNKKIPIWVNLEVLGSNGRCWYIFCAFGQFSGHVAYLMAVWYILPRFGTFLPVSECSTKKNLATLLST
jgi:hypothetical protein